MEYRTFKLELRDINEDTGRFTGYASVFNKVIGWYNERVMPGAFAQTLKQRGGKVPILWNHWSDEWIGMNESASEDSYGLLVNGVLNLNVQRAREAHSLAKQAAALGAPAGLSIGFRTVKESTGDDGVRQLHEISLLEYSITPFPAADDARVTDVRAAADLLYRRGIISREQYALGIGQGAEPVEADYHSISEALDAVLRRLAA